VAAALQAAQLVFRLYRFLSERVVKVWNFLPETVNFSSLGSFKHSISDIDFTDLLKYGYWIISSFVRVFILFSLH